MLLLYIRSLFTGPNASRLTFREALALAVQFACDWDVQRLHFVLCCNLEKGLTHTHLMFPHKQVTQASVCPRTHTGHEQHPHNERTRCYRICLAASVGEAKVTIFTAQ